VWEKKSSLFPETAAFIELLLIEFECALSALVAEEKPNQGWCSTKAAPTTGDATRTTDVQIDSEMCSIQFVNMMHISWVQLSIEHQLNHLLNTTTHLDARLICFYCALCTCDNLCIATWYNAADVRMCAGVVYEEA
jgi:hypothetical protein